MKSCHRFVGQTAAVLLASGLVASLLPDFAAAQDLSTREKRAAWVLGKCWDKFTPAERDHLKARLKGFSDLLGHGTENHAIMKGAAAYFFAQYWPDETGWVRGTMNSAQLGETARKQMMATMATKKEFATFESFQTAVAQNPPVVDRDQLSVTYPSLKGDTLTATWNPPQYDVPEAKENDPERETVQVRPDITVNRAVVPIDSDFLNGIRFLVRAAARMNDDRWLAAANRLAEEAVERLYDNGWFQSFPESHVYEAVGGVGELFQALILLDNVTSQAAGQ